VNGGLRRVRAIDRRAPLAEPTSLVLCEKCRTNPYRTWRRRWSLVMEEETL
jgi:hypothetical protein